MSIQPKSHAFPQFDCDVDELAMPMVSRRFSLDIFRRTLCDGRCPSARWSADVTNGFLAIWHSWRRRFSARGVPCRNCLAPCVLRYATATLILFTGLRSISLVRGSDFVCSCSFRTCDVRASSRGGATGGWQAGASRPPAGAVSRVTPVRRR